MATGTAGDFATFYPSNQVHYLSKKIVYTQEDVAVVVGELPPYASVLSAGVHVVTAFNGSGTDLLDIGFTTTYGVSENTDALATDLSLAAVGYITDTEVGATTNIMQTTPARIVATYTDANSDASAGEAWVIVTYVVNRPSGGPN